MAMKEKGQYQLELWQECRCNRCAFCNLNLEKYEKDSLLNPNNIISDAQKAEILEKALAQAHNIDWDLYNRITIRGGEVFNACGTLTRKAYLALYEYLRDKVRQGYANRIFLVTSLKYYFNDSALSHWLTWARRDNILSHILIGTSWDSAYRFNEKSADNWKRNMAIIQDAYSPADIHVTSILTGHFIQEFFNKNPELLAIMNKWQDDRFDFILPYGKQLGLKLDGFFPRRKDFIKFCIAMQNEYPRIWRGILHQAERRASKIFMAINGDELERDLENFSSDGGPYGDLLPCGHMLSYNIYSDSDRCAICDLLELTRNEGQF